MPAPNYTQIVGAAGQNFGVSAQTSDVQTATLVSELNARFYQLAYQGKLFSGGMQLTSINNATFTTATLGPTATPIVGLWNQGSSPLSLVLLQSKLQVVLTSLTTTGPGSFHWCTSTGNNALTLGNIPFNRKTFSQTGSQAKDLSGLALTGLTNNLVPRNAAGISGGSLYNISNVGTAAGFQTTMGTAVEHVDGAWIVPPGGVLALLCTTTPVGHSVGSGIVWAELPV